VAIADVSRRRPPVPAAAVPTATVSVPPGRALVRERSVVARMRVYLKSMVNSGNMGFLITDEIQERQVIYY
jgi:hypothetical protein